MSSIGFLDTRAHPHSDNFYHLFPNEPVPPEKSSNTVQVSSMNSLPKMSLDALLEKIIEKVKSKGSILIVSHGTAASLNVSVGDAKNKLKLQTGVLRAFEKNRAGKMSDKNAASIMKIDTKKLASYNDLIDKVQKLELERVDIRACNIGSNEYTLSDLRKFFNSHTLSAPKIYDTFGPIPFGKITKDTGTWNRWLTKHGDAIVDGVTPNRFALDYSITTGVALSCLAESKQAISDWVAKNLPKGNYSGGPLFYHGVTDKSKIIFSGNAKFRSYIVEAVKGKEPSKKIDLNNLDF